MSGARRFRVVSASGIQEFVEHVESATAALDQVRWLIKSGLPNVRIFNEDGRALSLSELEELADDDNESDDA